MSGDVLICPSCRARVFGDWHACKFCGATLRIDRIGATVDPDELVSADAPVTGAAPWGADPTVGSNVDGAPPVAERPPAPPGSALPDVWSPSGDTGDPFAAGSSFDVGDPTHAWGSSAGTMPLTDGSLVPVEGAGATWAPGPAPTVASSGDSSGTETLDPTEPSADSWDWDQGPAGLEPVSWYPEPGSSPEADDSGPAGLEPVSWYPEPGTTQAPSGTGSPGGSAGGHGVAPGSAPAASATVGIGTEPPNVDESSASSSAAGGTWGHDIEPVASRDDVTVNWEPAGADAWDAPIRPEGKPKRQAVLSREARLLVAGIVLILFILAAGVELRDRDAGHPSQWAANTQQMADWVAKERKMPFEHPVTVLTLGGDDYAAAVAEAGRPAKSSVRKGLTEQTEMWRALGAVQGDPSAQLQAVAAQRPELGAFYDLDHQRLVLRGGTDAEVLRQGLAGALSIALDDQRADLSSLRSTSIAENPRFDVVMGTAALMRSDYVHQRDAPRGNDGTAAAADDASTAGADTDPETAFVDARTDLQTRLGEPFVELVRDVRGVAAENSLVGAPPVASQQIMLPMAYFDGRGPLVGPEPEVPDGAEKLDEGTIGAQTWYLLLAAHLDGQNAHDEALGFVDRWAGDTYVAYRRSDGRVCVSDVIRGSDESQAVLLMGTLRQWRDAMPGGDVEVAPDGTVSVEVTACDRGPSTDQALRNDLASAVTAAVTRSRLAAGYYHDGKKIPNGVNGPVFEPHVAWCMGAEAVALAQPDQLEALGSRRGDTYRDLTLAAGARCNSNMADQLFRDHGD